MNTVAPQPKRPPAAQSALIGILMISLGATLFLLWLIYMHPPADQTGEQFAFLPGLNAVLNGMSATALLIGFAFIRAKNINYHWRAMVTAFALSTMFLVGYILHHALHGDVRYPAGAPWRSVYIPILISHIVLSAVALPMILITMFFSITRRFPQHKKIARWTFPLWLYVSVTGVITYMMLRLAMSHTS